MLMFKCGKNYIVAHNDLEAQYIRDENGLTYRLKPMSVDSSVVINKERHNVHRWLKTLKEGVYTSW